MNLDDRVCYCYHVPLRKLVHFARRERPARASQMSDCLGAGTGCGWCIPVLKRIHERVVANTEDGDPTVIDILPATAEEYASQRTEYIRQKEPRNRF